MPTAGELRRALRKAASGLGLDPRDADLLLADTLGLTPAGLIANDHRSVAPDDAEKVRAALARRVAGEPLQYIRGVSEFYGRDFAVDDRVLIPRPETELLVDAAVRFAPAGARIVDVGTGSGCIAATIALERHDAFVAGIDRSLAALAVARANASRLGAVVRFAAGDLLTALRGRFDLVVSNPPYIPAADVEGLQREVRDHEPAGALTPGPSGLEAIERLMGDAPRLLTPDGKLLMEIGWDQSEAVRALAGELGWAGIDFRPDLAGIPRVVVLSRRA